MAYNYGNDQRPRRFSLTKTIGQIRKFHYALRTKKLKTIIALLGSSLMTCAAMLLGVLPILAVFLGFITLVVHIGKIVLCIDPHPYNELIPERNLRNFSNKY